MSSHFSPTSPIQPLCKSQSILAFWRHKSPENNRNSALFGTGQLPAVFCVSVFISGLRPKRNAVPLLCPFSPLPPSTAALPPPTQRAAPSGGTSAAKVAPRASPSLSQSSGVGSPVGAANLANASSSGPSLAKIAIIQVLVLLSSMKEGYDETKADHLRKLIDAHGMDLFLKYFRQLVHINSQRIFSSAPSGKKFPTLPILVDEMLKLERDIGQAFKIAESLDTSEGEPFNDFDLAKFLDHFEVSVPARLSLALAIKAKCKKDDLKTKADAIIASSLVDFPQYLTESISDESLRFILPLIESLGVHTQGDWPTDWRPKIEAAILSKYQGLGVRIPLGYRSSLATAELLWSGSLARLLRRRGPKSCLTLESAKAFASHLDSTSLTPDEIVIAVLFMLFNCNSDQYNITNFIVALKAVDSSNSINWQEVLSGFDREGLSVTKAQFLRIYNAMYPLAVEDGRVDIQKLWGGSWKNPSVQLSFVVAFLSTTPEELDVSLIPGLKAAFTVETFAHCSEEVQTYAARAVVHPLVSLEATTALFSMVFNSQESYNQAQNLGIPDSVINANTDIFLVSAAGTPKPWTGLQDQALRQLFWPFLRRGLVNYDFVMAGLWKQDSQWLTDRIVDAYSQNPMFITFILDHAETHGWMEYFLALHSKLSLDLATLAHARGRLDLKKWFDEVQAAMPDMFPKVLAGFTVTRANLVIQAQRERAIYPAVDFSLKTVYEIVCFLENLLTEDELSELLRTCISAYPRLVNYGEGFDDIIENNAKISPQIPDSIDAKMQEHYKRMYSGESEVREIIEHLQRYKNSNEATDQDLFACMIHGLFDEYNCFSEYPNEALATTAVLFGGIINFNLLSRMALISALSMVYDSVKDTTRHDSMYKFGLQAMIQFVQRLPEWPYFCERVLRVPDLKGTEVWNRCETILRELQHTSIRSDIGTNHSLAAQEDVPPSDSLSSPFTCLYVDPPSEAIGFVTPDDSVSEKVLFVLNNVSEQNLNEKLQILKDVLVRKYYQWFASYLVEERAKPQPNFQQLYLQVLENLNDRHLWDEVLRETYVSVIHLLNSESTIGSSKDRGYLKNLGAWLGSLTVARDRPIKFRNISFKDLLTEGYSTNRLLLVIPFTCKVLAQVTRSTVFKPPNPWVMEILRILMELYHWAEINLKLKFEIEVLCKALGLDWNSIESSTHIRNQKIPEELFNAEPFVNNDLALVGLNRTRSRNERFSPSTIAAAIPGLISQLVYPPSSSRGIAEPRLRQIFQTAVQQALAEIISPVVERSVTIAAIAAAQLVTKDYATEVNEDLLREAAHSTVKPLSGSLALVTCKEPLRISITNHIRMMARDLSELALPEGIVLMFVNDNLDNICALVEQAAEAQSIAEIEQQIEDAIQTRRLHRVSHGDEQFMHPPVSRWGLFLPEPYKHASGGLTREQMEVYHDFGRSISRILTQGPLLPRDPSRPSAEFIDQFSTLSILNPGEAPQSQQLHQIQGPPQGQNPSRTVGFIPSEQQPLGYSTEQATVHRASELLTKLFAALKEASQDHIKDIGPGDPVRMYYGQLIHLIEVSGLHRDYLACSIAQRIPATLYADSASRLEIELFIQLLIDLRKLSNEAGRLITSWLSSLDDERIIQSEVTFYLLKIGLLPIDRMDLMLSRVIRQRKPISLGILAHILSETVFQEDSQTLRTSLALSFDALSHWLHDDPDNRDCQQLAGKLGVPYLDVDSLDEKQKLGLPEVLLAEWVNLLRANLPERFTVAFISQIHESKILQDQNHAIAFIRSCVEFVFTSFIEEASFGNVDGAYMYVDGLVKLIVSLIVYQPGEKPKGQKKPVDRLQFLEGILCLLVMILARHHNARVVDWNQRGWFRLFSTLFTELQTSGNDIPDFQQESSLIIGRTLLFLGPSRFPGFAFGWLNLLVHRYFMPVMLSPDHIKYDERQRLYLKLLCHLFGYISKLLNPTSDAQMSHSQFYRGTLRLMLIIKHDFPDFVVSNHLELLIPVGSVCRQLRNLILTAVPETLKDLPEPTTADSKVWDSKEFIENPGISCKPNEILKKAGLLEALGRLLRSHPSSYSDFIKQGATDLEKLFSALDRTIDSPKAGDPSSCSADSALIQAVALAVVISATRSSGFATKVPEVWFLQYLGQNLRPEARYYLVNALVDQLRYPNSHTRFVSSFIQQLFGQISEADAEFMYLLQQITRVFIERLSVYGPHPWGLLFTMHCILVSSRTAFFDLPFVKGNTEISNLFRAFGKPLPSTPTTSAT